MAQPTKSNVKSRTKHSAAKTVVKPARKAAVKAVSATTKASAHHAGAHTHGAEKLHYSKTALLKDYSDTYHMFIKALIVGIGGALVYFFVLAFYLGGYGHTKTDDYVREFGTRIDYEYKGLRMPEYDNPALLTGQKK